MTSRRGANRATGPQRDETWMRYALRLAARGRGQTSPNPMVGAVVVKAGQLVGKGFHREAGGPHAEIWALREAHLQGAARGATVYVTLEPCCHHGRTPPCTEALIAAGVGRVVAATPDPDPRVRGAGVRQLRQAGVEVDVGVLEEEARRLNEAYLKRVATGLPFVALKAAMSLDGKIATAEGESRWITGEPARRASHRLRATHDAIMVGVETALADDPELTVRLARGRNPLRVVVDSRARTPTTARLLTSDQRRPIVAITEQALTSRRERLQAAGAEVLVAPTWEGRVDLCWLLARIAERGANSVLVEGGGTLAAGALAAGVVDRVYFFVAPVILGGAKARTPVEGEGVKRLAVAWRLHRMQVRRIGEDLLIAGDLAGNTGTCSLAS